ncbi:hypothetical protein B0F90DRAFT_1815543 [Multifurca ochricompacta]|uniref:Uncharacterized protein n=1 Tax=Multifurca ochricompacta TaxID=376703 RepID=A0AAD4QQM9_9AGAM|nr:hypothetical protein B0F90DRAFT_1815543 [Multifurca ochricompacta]
MSPESGQVRNLDRQATSSLPSPLVLPPTHPQTSPSSTADSHSAGPSSPHAPPRGRPRYPSGLAHDGLRVPLHRRGTSKTYERLEDLLKEAGYKETRVFTPEADRCREHERAHGKGNNADGVVRTGVDTVVGFLAGLVLGPADVLHTETKAYQSDIASKLGNNSEPSIFRSEGITCLCRTLFPGSTAEASSSRTLGSRGQPLGSGHIASNDYSFIVRPSPAQDYLRHIASAPNTLRRSLPGERAPLPAAKKSTISLKDGIHTQDTPSPPLPPSWFKSIARAILGSSVAHIGRHHTADTHPRSPSPPEHSRLGHSSQPMSHPNTVCDPGRSNRKYTIAGVRDTGASLRGRSTPSLPTSFGSSQPPNILAMRSQVSSGQVVKMNVICHSGPVSRSSFLARRKPGSDSLTTTSLGNLSGGSSQGKGKAQESTSRKSQRKRERDLANSGPSLSVRVETDGSILGDGGDYDSISEDEDEGEVDLSKLLVHPRRQQSINSLRRHLERTSKFRGEDNVFFCNARAWTLRGGDCLDTAPDGSGRTRRGSVNDGDWGVLVTPRPGRDSRTSHRRRALPVSWTQQSGSSRR